jgi:hypothetical protein
MHTQQNPCGQRCYIHHQQLRSLDCTHCKRPICTRCAHAKGSAGPCPACVQDIIQARKRSLFCRCLVLVMIIGLSLLGMALSAHPSVAKPPRSDTPKPLKFKRGLLPRKLPMRVYSKPRVSHQSTLMGRRRMALHRVLTKPENLDVTEYFGGVIYRSARRFYPSGSSFALEHVQDPFGQPLGEAYHRSTFHPPPPSSGHTFGRTILSQLMSSPPRHSPSRCRLPVSVHSSGAMSIEVLFEDEAVQLLIDTGTPKTCICGSTAEDLDLNLLDETITDTPLNGGLSRQLIRIEDVELGGMVVGPLDVLVCDDCSGAPGLLGTDVMRLFDVSIHPNDAAIYVAQCED